MGLREVIKEACITAVGIVLAALLLSYIINLGRVLPALSGLPLWTALVALLSIAGKVLSAMMGVSGAMQASVVAPEVAGYARGAVRVAHEELSSWVGHLLGMVASVILAYVVRCVAFAFMHH